MSNKCEMLWEEYCELQRKATEKFKEYSAEFKASRSVIDVEELANLLREKWQNKEITENKFNTFMQILDEICDIEKG